ncbi:PREDICTED: tctex1 domain-containing protein 2 [Capra hircus]|uniref:tctex1 domain-containing protein 2 n=1 Tax=Capra hircus TaxID=9925 RepID=UPI0008472101|nr:PREDICTED: tctex1 domain-containing protein 2 [Capra hircus]
MRRRKGEGGESTLRRAGPTGQSAGPLHAGSKAALSPWRRLTSCPRPPTQLSLRTTRGQEAEAMSVAASFPKRASFAAADGLPETENNAGEPENTYILRPIFQQRFRPSVVKDCIHAVLKEELASAEYSPEEMPQLTKHLSENIKDKLKEMGFDRYKMVVQVVIGEQRGEGVFMAARCFWDADTDNCTHDVFMNDSLFCVVAAFGCFYY